MMRSNGRVESLRDSARDDILNREMIGDHLAEA